MTYTKTETAILYHYLIDEVYVAHEEMLVTPSINYAMNRSYNKVVLVEELNKGIVRRIERYGDEWRTTMINTEEYNPLSIGNRIE